MFERAQSPWTRATALILLALPATAQKTEVEVKADLDFARGLATEWSFMDLAENVLDSIEKEGVSSKMEALLATTKCDMYAAAAVNEKDNFKRIELFTSALDAYGTLISRSYSTEGNEDYSLQAAYVDTAAKAIIAFDRALEEATGEAAETLTADKNAMLEAAITQTNDIVSEAKAQLSVEPTNVLRRNLWAIWRNGARLSTEYAVMNGNNEFDIKRSETFLEELVFDALNENSIPNVMLAYIGLGEHYMRIGRPSQALDYYTGVIEELIPTDAGLWKEYVDQGELNENDIYQRFIFLERATEGLMNAAAEAGYKEVGTLYALHFYNVWKQYGYDLSPPGYMSLLACAGGLLEFGGYVGGNQNSGETAWYETVEEMEAQHKSSREQDDAVSFALRLARTVGESNRGNILQLRSQKLVSTIISRPGVEVSPDMLYEAARGEYFEDNFTAALDGYKRLLRDLDSKDQATRTTYGAKVMNGIGNCFRKMNRPLESALAFREGCTTWVGDVEFDENNANGFYRMAQEVQRGATSEVDPLSSLVVEAENIVANIGTKNADEVLFNMGQKHERNKEWEEAVSKYSQVEQGSDWWERAQAQIGAVHFQAKQYDEALVAFDSYLEDFLKDPKNADAGSDARRARRAEAAATATVFRGYIYRIQASKSGDATDHQKVVDSLQTFHTDFPTQERSAPVAALFVLQSQLDIGDIDGARRTLDRMLADYPDAGQTGRASTAFAQALKDLLQASTDEDEKRAITLELAQRLKAGNESNPDAPFANLRNESSYWLDIGEFTEAERVLKRLVEKFSDVPERRDDLFNFVLPDLARTLIAQRRLGEAKGALDPVVTAEDFSASRTTQRLWATAMCGWLEGKGSSITEIPGAGGTPEEYEKAAEALNKIEAGYEKWLECEWYVVKFEIAYAYYRAAQEHDSRKMDLVERVLGPIEPETGTNFSKIDDFCSEGTEDDPTVVARYGGYVLRDHYRWLSDKL